MREWRRSRINRAAHNLSPHWAGVTTLQSALPPTASEPRPSGRRAAHHVEAGGVTRLVKERWLLGGHIRTWLVITGDHSMAGGSVNGLPLNPVADR